MLGVCLDALGPEFAAGPELEPRECGHDDKARDRDTDAKRAVLNRFDAGEGDDRVDGDVHGKREERDADRPDGRLLPPFGILPGELPCHRHGREDLDE